MLLNQRGARRGRTRWRLASRVAVAVSALALTFVLLTGGGAWLVTTQVIRSQMSDLLQVEATLRADRVGDLIRRLDEHFHTISTQDELVRALRDQNQLYSVRTEIVERAGMPVTIDVADAVGRVVTDANPAGAVDPWVAASVASGVSRSKVTVVDGVPEVLVAEPLVSGDPTVALGALVWRVTLADLARRAAIQAGSAAGEVRIEADGRVVAQALDKGVGDAEEAVRAETQVNLGPHLAMLHMTLRLVVDQDVLAGSLQRLTTTFLAIGAAMTLLVVVFGGLLGRRLTAAVSQLAEAAGSFDVRSGDPQVFLMPGDDEIARLGLAFAGMVERLNAAFHDLERRGQTLLSNAERIAHLGSASWDVLNDRHVWSNQFYALLGVSPQEEGASLEAFLRRVHPVDRDRMVAELDQARSGRRDGRIVADVRLCRPDGEERVGLLRAEATRDTYGQVARLDITIQDITERKALEQKLDALVLELRRSNAELEQFAYVASHDLRQPLRTVRSYVTLIEEAIDSKLDTETREFMEFIRDGVRRMDTLITDLLAYSRVGRTSTDVPVDSGRAADLAVMDLQSEIDATNAQVHIPSRMPVVTADAGEMARLFQNLIGNAIKYRAPERTPKVVVAVLDLGSAWEFTITDNGIGIPGEYSERVFGIFQRLHARDEYEGTGIGLAICRKVVERHGGRIWFTPATEGGTVFHFTLPKLKRIQEVASA